MSTKENKDRLGDYQFIKTIGEGTFGKVKLSLHLPTKEYVAIKILEKCCINDKDEFERIKKEIKYLKMLNHPNIIQIYEAPPLELTPIMEIEKNEEKRKPPKYYRKKII